MRWVHSSNIENLDCAWFRWESVDIVSARFEVLNQGKCWGKAVGQCDCFWGEDGAVLTCETLVLQACNEAENISTSCWSINGLTGCDGDGDWRAIGFLSIQSVHPAEAIGVDSALLILETDKSWSEVPLKTILDRIDPLLGPRSPDSGFSTLINYN